MKLIKLLICISFATLAPCYGQNTIVFKQLAATISQSLTVAVYDLWRGIEQADAQLVLRTIRKEPDVLRVKFGHYGDTPLMASIRKYGQELQAMHERPTRLTMTTLGGSLLAAIAAGELVSYLVKPTYGLLTGAIVFSYTCSVLAARHAIPHEKIVGILLQSTTDLHTRNREGLTALDVLRAYHQYAQELKESSWFQFHSWLTLAMQEK
jgi:hypothetical protein